MRNLTNNDIVIERERFKIIIRKNNNEGLLCRPETILINEKRAYLSHFGKSKDLEPSPEDREGCGNRVFIPNKYTLYYKLYYGLDEDSFNELVEILKDEFSLGDCSFCKKIKKVKKEKKEKKERKKRRKLTI